MSDLLSIIADSQALQILTLASVVVPGLFEIYLGVVTSRRAHDSVLGKELEAFFDKLQSKWAAKARDLEGQR